MHDIVFWLLGFGSSIPVLVLYAVEIRALRRTTDALLDRLMARDLPQFRAFHQGPAAPETPPTEAPMYDVAGSGLLDATVRIEP